VFFYISSAIFLPYNIKFTAAPPIFINIPVGHLIRSVFIRTKIFQCVLLFQITFVLPNFFIASFAIVSSFTLIPSKYLYMNPAISWFTINF
jgi:hypothetical protein